MRSEWSLQNEGGGSRPEPEVASHPIKKFNLWFNKHLARNTLASDDFTGEFLSKLREEVIPILHKLFQKVEEEGILVSILYEPRLDMARNLQTNVPQKYRYRNSQHEFRKTNLRMYSKDSTSRGAGVA